MALIAFVAALGYIPGLTMRFLALLGSDSAIVIVKSVSEHQPTSWGTYWFDEHLLTFMTATGILLCFYKVSDTNLFAILYGVFSGYFSNIMIRLMLVVSPAMCVLGAIAVSEAIKAAFETLIARTRGMSALLETGRKTKGLFYFCFFVENVEILKHFARFLGNVEV